MEGVGVRRRAVWRLEEADKADSRGENTSGTARLLLVAIMITFLVL